MTTYSTLSQEGHPSCHNLELTQDPTLRWNSSLVPVGRLPTGLSGRSSLQALLKKHGLVLTLVRSLCRLCSIYEQLKHLLFSSMSQLLTCPFALFHRAGIRSSSSDIALTNQLHVKPLLFLPFWVWSCHTQGRWSLKILVRNIFQLLLRGINMTLKRKNFSKAFGCLTSKQLEL